jgi:signal transduction histidine kinase
MKVRTGLVLAFAYVLITVIVALTVPLAVTLRDRSRIESESQALSSAQTFASSLDANDLGRPASDPRLHDAVAEFASQIPQGRVVVLDANGTVVADSLGEDMDKNYANGLRPEVESALGDPPTPLVETRHSDEIGADLLAAAAPILDNAVLVGAVRVTQDISQVTSAVNRVTIGVIIVGATGLIAGLVIAFALAGSLARPLSRLAATARRLGSGDLSARAGDVRGAREIDDLGHSFDEMADRLERTVHAQREFVANASHQLRTPLTGMKLRLESAAAASDDPEVTRQMRAADTEVDRLAETVNRLLLLARDAEAGTLTSAPPTDLRAAAARACERWREQAERVRASVQTTGEEATAAIDPTDLDQIIDNLLDNALAYAPGAVDIETGLETSRTFLAVRDRGAGIPADERARVTERFYRGRGAPTGGSGLGLAIVRDLAERWGGSVAIEAPDDGGTRVVVTLPARPPSS